MTTATLSRWPTQLPIAFDATPSSLIQDAEAIIDQTRRVWDAISSNVGKPDKATFSNVILPIIEDENARLSKARVIRFYASTSPSKELRKASNAATKMLNDADAELYCRADVFVLVDAILERLDDTNLDDESRYYLLKLHRKLYMNGCGIQDPATKQAFEDKNKRIQELVRQCTSNLHEDSSGLWLTPEELEGVPEDIIAALKRGDPGSEYEGKLWLKTKIPHPNKILTWAKSDATRKTVYYAIKNRLPQNVPLLRELVLARDSMARMLGYPSYLAYKTADKMVQTPETVTSLLDEIRWRIRPAALAEVDELLAVKREDGDPEAEHVFAWDENFYRRIRSEKKQPDRASVSEYFELYSTLAKMLGLYGRLFGTRFERITPEQQAELGKQPLVWHEDVQMYAVWDMDGVSADVSTEGSFLGYAYFDLFPREGKYGHRGCYSLQWGFNSQAETLQPSCALVMNYTKPVDSSSPTLLSLVDVRRLFHELGHLHHSLCTKVKHASLSYIDRDFSEAPCLMLERLFWKESYISDLSSHYSYLSTKFHAVWLDASRPKQQGLIIDESVDDAQARRQPPLKLPDQVVKELADLNPKQFVDGQVYNVFLSLFDVLVHNPATHEELQNMNLAAEYNKLHAEITGFSGGKVLGDGWEWGQGQSVFRMIVSGYDAGYYSYVLGRVHSLDMWKSSGFNVEMDAAAEKKAGRRFRRSIFEPGGSQPEMKTLAGYLGREPSSVPYFEWLGV